MPETFGGGTAGSSFDPRSAPSSYGRGQVPPLTETSVGLAEAFLYVVTNIDVVAVSGGIGGEAFFSFNTDSTLFWTIKVGDSTDDFSYRGYLVIAGGTGEAIVINNQTDGQLHYTICGFACPEVIII